MTRSTAQKSTIVRAKSRAQQNLVHVSTRVAFRLAERRAPRLGSRWAERVWLTLPKKAWTPADDPAELGEPFEIHLDGRGARPRHTVRGEVWGDAGPPVYLVHGWGGYRGQLDAFVEPLVDAGHRVVAFDAPSHGESDPGGAGARRGLLPEFANALTASAERFGEPHAVVAHSLGASATALAVLDGLRPERLVFVAPMTDPIAYSHVFAQMLGFGERIRTGFLSRLERRVGRPMTAFDIPSRIRAGVTGTLPPMLIVHDLKDREAPYRGSEGLADAWPGVQLSTTEGLGHHRILCDPDVIAEVVKYTSGMSTRSDRRN